MARLLTLSLTLSAASALTTAPRTTPPRPDVVASSRRQWLATSAFVAAAAAAPALAADILKMPPATTKMGGLLEKYADVTRGFRMMKPTTWNEFTGEPGAYDVRFVDVVSPVDSITLSTSAYTANPTITALADAPKLGAKLAASRGELVGTPRARESDGIVFYDFEFSSDVGHEILTMCVHKNKLWQMSAKAPEKSWAKRKDLYQNAVGSFVPKL